MSSRIIESGDDAAAPTSVPDQDIYRRRTRELAALYATAGDLSSMRDVDQVLDAIVKRGRQLLATDMAYLMLIDDDRQDTFMRVSAGTQSPDFMSIRLAYGEGIGGLVAQTGAPQWTSNFADDPRFAHAIAPIIGSEGIVAILAVPLMIAGSAIGVLFASDRRERTFGHEEVALLSSLADHAAIALENARLFEDRERSLERLHEANQRVEAQNQSLERAAEMHERLTELVTTGASLDDVARVVGDGLGGQVLLVDSAHVPLTPVPPDVDLEVVAALLGRHTEQAGDPETGGGPYLRVAPIRTKTTSLGCLVYAGDPLGAAEVRALERAAMVTALLLLDVRAHDEALGRMMSELFVELTDPDLSDEEQVMRRAHAAGFRLGRGPYLVLSAIEDQRRVEGALGAQLASMAQAHRGLAGTVGGGALVIVPGSDPAAATSEAARSLSEKLGSAVTVGGAGPYESLREAAAAYPRATNCAKVLVTLGRVGQGATPADLGLYTLLFSDVARSQIESFVTETIGPVREYDATRDSVLTRTLEAYFDAGGQTGRIAEHLFIHVNTLYQRLDRVDQLLGAGWRRGETALEVHLALRLAHLLETTR